MHKADSVLSTRRTIASEFHLALNRIRLSRQIRQAVGGDPPNVDTIEASRTTSGPCRGLGRREFLAGAATLPLTAQAAPAMPAEASTELHALIDRCTELKVAVERLKREEKSIPPAERQRTPVTPAVARLEDALGDAFDLMWDAEDAVDAFQTRSAADIRLKARFALDYMYSDQSGGHGSDVFAWNVLRELAGGESSSAV
jgi:hypothetical protein